MSRWISGIDDGKRLRLVARWPEIWGHHTQFRRKFRMVSPDPPEIAPFRLTQPGTANQVAHWRRNGRAERAPQEADGVAAPAALRAQGDAGGVRAAARSRAVAGRA